MVELGERLEAAVRRETLEETGLLVNPLEVAAVFQRITPDAAGQTEYHYVVIDYLCELKGGTLQAASDVANAGWFTEDEMLALKMAPGTPHVIVQARALAAGRETL